MTTTDLIPLSSILTDRGTQARAAINNDTVAEYAEAYAADLALPPLVLFRVGPDLILADGFHRLAGARRANLEMVNCEVRDGTLRDAILHAAGCNEQHGLRRTTADKVRAVLMLLEDKEWKDRSNRWIAEACKVSDHFVANVRVAGHNASSSSTANTRSSGQTKPRKGRDGKVRKPRKKKPAATKPTETKTEARADGLHDWTLFEQGLGILSSQIDTVGARHNAKGSAEAQAFRQRLRSFRDDFTAWEEHLREGKPPQSDLPGVLDTTAFRQTWERWLAYRKETKHPLKVMTKAAQLKQLAGWGEQKAIASLEASITNGWQGIFDPEASNGRKGTPQRQDDRYRGD